MIGGRSDQRVLLPFASSGPGRLECAESKRICEPGRRLMSYGHQAQARASAPTAILMPTQCWASG
jgi:hypothetical protein